MQKAKQILLADDDLDDQFFFCEALKELHSDIECQIANDGVEALELIEKIPGLDIIFLDLNMPRLNGFECLSHLKSNPLHKHIPVVILSTTSRVVDVEMCMQLGATMFVSKPTTFEAMFSQLNTIIVRMDKDNGISHAGKRN